MQSRIDPLRLVVAAALLTQLGCDGASQSPTTPSATSPPPAPASAASSSASPPSSSTRPENGEQTYTLRGVVRSVDPEKGEVTIAHEAIPGFMGAMVMPFAVSDRAILDDVRAHDIVHGPLVVRFARGSIEGYRLSDLTVTGTAAPDRPEGASANVALPRVVPLKIGEVVPDFALTMQDGTSIRLSDLRGKVVALTFIYTRCPLPDFCPAVDGKFADLLRLVAANPARAEQVRLVSVSFDAQHDTPEVLREHAGRRGARPPWSFAVAEPAELARVGPLLGLDYYPDRNEFAHNLTTAVIGPDGRLARLELGRGWTPSDVAKTIIGLIPRAKALE